MSNAFPIKNESEEGDPLLSHNYIFGLKYVLEMPQKSQEQFQMSNN
jgi:hypothetical protein